MNVALVFAGGTGIRMNSRSLPKQFLTFMGRPIIIYTLEHFEQHSDIDSIVVVCLKEWETELRKQIKRWQIEKVKWIVEGGLTSQESIYNGLKALKNESIDGDAVVLIHDGVRPLINKQVISDNINMVRKLGNCITVAQEHETFVRVDEDNCVDFIGSRGAMRIAKAPQSFVFRDIIKCHEQALLEGNTNFIDSASLMLHYGRKLHTTLCESSNIKITTPSDYYIFKALYEAIENVEVIGL